MQIISQKGRKQFWSQLLKRILDHRSQIMTDNEKDDNAAQIKLKWQYKPEQSHHLKRQNTGHK
jgi:hypothetical protein